MWTKNCKWKENTFDRVKKTHNQCQNCRTKTFILEAKQMGAAENAAELEAKDAKKRAQQLAEIKRKETSLVSSIGASRDVLALQHLRKEEELNKLAEEMKRNEEERLKEFMIKKKIAEKFAEEKKNAMST